MVTSSACASAHFGWCTHSIHFNTITHPPTQPPHLARRAFTQVRRLYFICVDLLLAVRFLPYSSSSSTSAPRNPPHTSTINCLPDALSASHYSMDSRKGFPPVSSTRSAGVELTRSCANVTQNNIVPRSSRSKAPRDASSHVDGIRNDLRRFVPSSVQTEPAPTLDFSFQFPPVAPLSSLPNRLTRMAPRSASPAPSTASSRASSRSRDELRADMRRVVPPSDIPHSSYQVTTGKFWPQGNTLHSRNTSKSSISTDASTNLSVVPELSPSKSESHFDTTSTRAAVNFGETKETKERALYGPLEIDESCFSFGSNEYNQLPSVAWTTTTKDDPILFNNVLSKANDVFCGDPNMFDEIDVPSAAEIRTKERKAQQLRMKREQKVIRDWANAKGVPVEYAVQVNEYHERMRAERAAAQEALRTQYAAVAEWRDENKKQDSLKPPPGLSSRSSALSSLMKGSQQVVFKSETSGSDSDSNDSAWETCENSPVHDEQTSMTDISVENSNDTTNSDEIVPASATDCDNEKGHKDENEENGYEEDEEDDCAIESCSTICQSARGRRYW